MKSLRSRRRRLTGKMSSASEQCEVRSLLSAVSTAALGLSAAELEVAAIDGTGNNVDNPEQGSTYVELIRISEAEYADGVESPAGEDRVSARVISNAIGAQSESILNDRGLTDFTWIWGQFLDHDIDLTENADPAEAFNIQVPVGDVHFDPFGTGQAEISLNRSLYVDGEDSSDGVRQQLNEITAFIDGSVVYGSDDETASLLRTFSGGLLKTSEGDLLPFEEVDGESTGFFQAGDIRVNENVALISMQTLWVREHNRIATELAEADPSMSDEELYQAARSIVRAEIQAITYNEFLPALLGADALSEYGGYDPTVDASISNEFSTAAYRLGHSLLSSELQRLDADGNVIEAGNLALAEAFFSPDEVAEHGIDSILRGASTQLAQELDTQVIDDVRNFLFGPPGAGGLDLVSLNVQRGRDHGLADYNQVREDLGLGRVTDFSDITSDPELALALEETYGSVDNIDLWVGGLAEDHVDGASVGETFRAILVDQFERIRSGDRFWYENMFSGDELETLQNTTLADVIERNTDISGLQENLFFAQGTEVLTVDAAAEQTDNIEVVMNDGRLEVRDMNRQEVIVSRPADEVGGVQLIGADGRRERFVIRMQDMAAAMNVSVDGGSGRGDVLQLLGTDGDDTMQAVGQSVEMANIDVVFSDIDRLILEGGDGDDTLDASLSSMTNVDLNGGPGMDTLIDVNGETVRDRRDRMFRDPRRAQQRNPRRRFRGQQEMTPVETAAPANDTPALVPAAGPTNPRIERPVGGQDFGRRAPRRR